MSKNQVMLLPWQEIVGTCKSITTSGTEISITLQTFGKTIHMTFFAKISKEDLQRIVNKQVAILRTDKTYTLRECKSKLTIKILKFPEKIDS